MFYIITSSIKRFGWDVFTEYQMTDMEKKLRKISLNTGTPVRNMKYEDFYMSKEPEMSLSNWVNQVNSQIRK